MRTHNHLLGKVDGCDGFKTGYFKKAGFSIAATAEKNGVRIIAIVMGSKDRKVRDAKATELLAKGFAMVPSKPEPKVAATQPESAPKKVDTSVVPETKVAVPIVQNEEPIPPADGSGWTKFFLGLGVGFTIFATLAFFVWQKRTKGTVKYHRRP